MNKQRKKSQGVISGEGVGQGVGPTRSDLHPGPIIFLVGEHFLYVFGIYVEHLLKIHILQTKKIHGIFPCS